MTIRTGIGWTAEDQKKGMSLKELRDFVERIPLDMDHGARVKVTAGWGGQIREMRVEEVER